MKLQSNNCDDIVSFKIYKYLFTLRDIDDNVVVYYGFAKFPHETWQENGYIYKFKH